MSVSDELSKMARTLEWKLQQKEQTIEDLHRRLAERNKLIGALQDFLGEDRVACSVEHYTPACGTKISAYVVVSERLARQSISDLQAYVAETLQREIFKQMRMGDWSGAERVPLRERPAAMIRRLAESP